MKLIVECEVKSSCVFFKSNFERRMMLKLWGGTAMFQIEMGMWHGLKREERVCKGCDSGEVEDVCHWLLQCSSWDHLRQPLLEAMDEEGRTSQQKMMETEQPLYYHLHVRNIIFYLSLPLCGELGSINPSVLFMLISNLSFSLSLLTTVSLHRIHLYLFLWSVQCYIKPCGVLVPIGTVHFNNELN